MSAIVEPRERNSHIWEREAYEHYVEEPWVSKRLFEEWCFDGSILDPACGFGHIVHSARSSGLDAFGQDIAWRAHDMLGGLDWLTLNWDGLCSNIVCNPPFDKIREFTELSVKRAALNVAMIFPTRRLNAAGSWLKDLPLCHIYYLTPRPSMPPGHVYRELEAQGKRPSGGTQDFAWLIFRRGFRGAPTAGWLHRDGGTA